MTKREAIPDGTRRMRRPRPEGPGDTTVDPVDVKPVDVKAEAKSNGPVPVAEWENPLRDPRDRRLPYRGPLGPRHLRCHRRPVPQEADAGIYDLANRGLLPPGFSLVGFARRDWEDEDFAQIVHDSVKEHARTPCGRRSGKHFAEGMRFIPGTFDDDTAFEQLRSAIEELDAARGTSGNYAFYLSVPKFFPKVVQQLKKHGLASPPEGSWRRAVDREAFGHDLESARELNALVHDVFDRHPHRPLPRQGDRPEHPGAPLRQPDRADLEPVRYVDHVQITMAEDIGIGGRAGYYDGIGSGP